jgi:hypothetical protein
MKLTKRHKDVVAERDAARDRPEVGERGEQRLIGLGGICLAFAPKAQSDVL